MKLGLTNKCSVSTDFETNREEATLEYLGKYFDNARTGMTPQRYFEMCAAMGDVPEEHKIPPDYEDFPLYVHDGIEIFNALPDTYISGMSTVYIGKDYSAITCLFDIFKVDVDMRMKVFKVIKFLDNRARKQAATEAKNAAKTRK